MNDVVKTISDANNEKNRTREWLDAHSDTSPELGGGLANSEDDQGIAGRLYSLCLRVLRQMCRQEQYKPSSETGISMLKEEVGKLYLWGEAFRDGKLDRALEYSDEVRSNVLESLGDIGRLLLREVWPSSISIPESSSSQKPIQELKYLVEQARAIISSKDNLVIGIGVEEGGSDTDDDDISEDDVTGDVFEELGLHTRWLTQLAPTLEQNLIHAENARYQTSCRRGAPFLVSGPAAIYVSLVREKYRQAQNQLVERLGEANWQRHVKVRTRMEASVDAPSPAEELAVAKSLFRPYSAFHDSGIGTSVQGQTQYASSFQSSNTEGERESLRVPATPAEVHDGKSFQCFLCKSMLSNIKNRVDWKMHIFSDLQPYICTFTECRDEMAQFPSRAAWAEHEFSNHRTTQSWTCPECAEDFLEISTWEKHLQDMHRLFFSRSNLQVAKDMALKTEARRIEDDECPLCRIVVGKPRRGFVKHVGRHMEEIALMALPRDVEEDIEEGSLSTDHTSLEKSSQSFHSKLPTEKDREEAALQWTVQKSRKPTVSTAQVQVPSLKSHDMTEEVLAGDNFSRTGKAENAAGTIMNTFKDEAHNERSQPQSPLYFHHWQPPGDQGKSKDKEQGSPSDRSAHTSPNTQPHEGAGAHIEVLEGSSGFANSDPKSPRGGVAPPGGYHSSHPQINNEQTYTPEQMLGISKGQRVWMYGNWQQGPPGQASMIQASQPQQGVQMGTSQQRTEMSPPQFVPNTAANGRPASLTASSTSQITSKAGLKGKKDSRERKKSNLINSDLLETFNFDQFLSTTDGDTNFDPAIFKPGDGVDVDDDLTRIERSRSPTWSYESNTTHGNTIIDGEKANAQGAVIKADKQGDSQRENE